MMGQDKKITPNPFNVHAYYRDGQGDEATFKTWWVVEYSKDAGKTWTKMAFNSQTSGITINPDSYYITILLVVYCSPFTPNIVIFVAFANSSTVMHCNLCSIPIIFIHKTIYNRYAPL